jgi:hypothetical protein
MPFGKKADSAGLTIDFDMIYSDVIRPAILDAALDPLRADEEMTGGIIHKPMYERLILCPFAVADLTTANPNVLYELGIRHAARPASTMLIAAEGGRLPFDVGPLRTLMYRLTPDGRADDPASFRATLAARLREMRTTAAQQERPSVDSPLYQLVDSYPNVQHEKTDVFRKQVAYAEEQKKELAARRKDGLPALTDFENSLGDINDVEAGVLIDLFLSYRAVKGWQPMIDLARRMPKPLAATVMVQEQYALALNRAGHDVEAEAVLRSLLATRGPSSETYGILGRVLKDRYDRAQSANAYQTRSELQKAIDVYVKGFEADLRDPYPGINAVTLMELRDPVDPRQKELLPVVTYAVKRRVAAGNPDYWDYATLVELAVLARDEDNAREQLGNALTCVRESWEPETTLRNLRLIAEAREARGETIPEWLKTVLQELARVAG